MPTLCLQIPKIRPCGFVFGAAIAVFAVGCSADQNTSRAAKDPAVLAVAPKLDAKGQVLSPLIDDLRARKSLLANGSAYAEVAQSVIAANRSAAEVEVQVKRLTAQAKSKNWLPRIGTEVSLNSLGSVLAGLVLEQGIFDQGGRKAERDFAAADVEVAAVGYARDLNRRVYSALKLYIDAQRAAELSAITSASLTQMHAFERIIGLRVAGGLSDRSEERVIAQKRAQTLASLTSEQQGERTAWAELARLTDRPLNGLKGLSNLPQDQAGAEPLSVLLARAETARNLAEIRMSRAGLRPGLGLSAGLERSGDLDASLNLEGDFLSFDRGDKLAALDAAETLALRKVDEARRDADLALTGLQREVEALTVQSVQDGRVVAEMVANLELFQAQYAAGRKTLLELVNHFESLTSARRSFASLKYQIARARLEIALMRGELVNGGWM